MLIETLNKKKGGTKHSFPAWPTENVPNKTAPAATYHFKPTADHAEDEDAPHVCDVKNRVHADRFLESPGFRVVFADEDTDLSQAPPKPAISGAPPVIEKAADTTEPVMQAPPALAAAPAPTGNAKVEEIRLLSVRDLKAKINTFSVDDLTAARAAEAAVKDEPPRKTWLEVVDAFLGAGDGS